MSHGDTPWDGDFSSHPEVSTAPHGRGNYPESLWDHPEPNIDTVVDLGDEGLNDGDTIDGYLDDYLNEGVRVEIPPGTYNWNRGGITDVPNSHLYGQGGLGDVVFDHSGASDRVVVELDRDVQIIEGIDVVGYADPSSAGHRVAVNDPDAELIWKHFRTVDGTTPDGNEATNGFYMDSFRSGDSSGHRGTLRFLWCQLTRYGDNGLYCDGPVVDEDALGQVIVVGGEYRGCNISFIRIGHYGHTVYGTRLTGFDRDEIPLHDEYNQQRGIRIRQPEPNSAYDWLDASDNLIDQCEWYYPPGAGGAGLFVIADELDESKTTGRVLRCRMENHSGSTAIADDHGTLEGDWQVHDTHIYGSGDLDSELTLRGDSEVGSSADRIHSNPWWGLNLGGGTDPGDGDDGETGTIQSPSNLRVISTDSESISLSWDAVDQPTGVTLSHYNVYLNGSEYREVNAGTTATTVSGLDPDTQHEIGVSSVADDGTESGQVTLTATTDDVVEGSVEIGGGETYPFRIREAEADVSVSSLSGLQSALDSASEGDIVFIEQSASIEIPSRDDVPVVPSGVTLASNRGINGDPGGLIHKDSWSGFGSGSFYGIVRVRAGGRVTGLRVRGNLPTSSTWYDASDAGSVQDRMDAGIRVLGGDVRIDNCEVYDTAAPIVNGRGNVRVHHSHLHGVRLYDPNDQTASVSFGIYTDGAPAPEPVYEHNLIEHCRLPFGSDGDGGFVARHNIVRGPILQPTFQIGAGGGTSSTIRNVTAEVYQNDLTSDQLPNVRVYDVPDESAIIQDSHLYNPDAPVSSPAAGDTDNAIVQIDSSTGDAITWSSVNYSGNHYGSSTSPIGVGARPLGDPDTIGRPDNLAATESDPGDVTLTWDPPDNTGSGIERYNVYVDGRIRTQTDASPISLSVDEGATVNFEVTAVDSNEVESFPSRITVETSTGAPGMPANYSVANVASTSISVSWEPPTQVGAGLSHYRVYRNGTEVAQVGHVDGQDSYVYTHKPLTPGTEYDLSVRSVDTEGELSDAAAVTQETDGVDPNAPGTPTLEPRDVAVTRIALEVTPPEDTGNTPLDRYDLYVDGEFARELAATTGIFVQPGLDPQTTYRFAVRAVNTDGYVSGAATAVATTLQPGSNHRGTPIGEDEESCGFGDIQTDAGPPTPGNLRIIDDTFDNVVVRWDPPEDESVEIDYYNVYVGGLIEDQTEGIDTTLSFPESEVDETRTVGVQAVDKTGLSSDVAEIEVTLAL